MVPFVHAVRTQSRQEEILDEKPLPDIFPAQRSDFTDNYKMDPFGI